MTFLHPLHIPTLRPHLWIIATAPDRDGQFVIVNLTSLKGAKDQTVVLQKGEHPFVRWDTCVNYALAEMSNVDRLDQCFTWKEAELHSEISEKIMSEILAGFSASPFTKKRIVEFVARARIQAAKKSA